MVAVAVAIWASGAGHATKAIGRTTAGSLPTRTTRPTANPTVRTPAGAARPALARASQAGPSYPQLLPSALATRPTTFTPVVRWRARTAAWIARSSSGVTMMAFDQRLLELHLHSGTVDAGTLGWRYGPSIAGTEQRRIAAAFNGGFKLDTNSGGFQSFGRVGAPLRPGLASVVTYANGTTDIGSWQKEVPARGQTVVSVRQNLTPLIDHGAAASTLGCVSCWGATLGGVTDPARSALGIAADGRLVWAAGEHLTVSGLVNALLDAHVVRAVELDINPEWVAGYLYGHRGGHGPLAPVPALADQHGIPGQYLAPWSRDFFTVVAR